jgi:hypothetical protein
MRLALVGVHSLVGTAGSWQFGSDETALSRVCARTRHETRHENGSRAADREAYSQTAREAGCGSPASPAFFQQRAGWPDLDNLKKIILLTLTLRIELIDWFPQEVSIFLSSHEYVQGSDAEYFRAT